MLQQDIANHDDKNCKDTHFLEIKSNYFIL